MHCSYCIKCIILLFLNNFSYCSLVFISRQQSSSHDSCLILLISSNARALNTFDVDDMLPNLCSDLDVWYELDEIINCVNARMNWFKALDFLSDGVGIVQNRLKMGSWGWIIVVYCHIYFCILLLRLSNSILLISVVDEEKTFFSSFVFRRNFHFALPH
jgi:hypothetical protein